MEEKLLKAWKEITGEPREASLASSQRRLQEWYERTAPMILWDVIESPLGPLYLAMNSQGLWRLDFAYSDANFLASLEPRARIVRDPRALEPAGKQLSEYFGGKRSEFSLVVDLSGLSPFQQDVLRAIRTIPAGKVCSYGEVARIIGRPKASRAVGQALGSNPIPIIIPCHRVLASDGNPGGYSGGLERKRYLLRLENAL